MWRKVPVGVLISLVFLLSATTIAWAHQTIKIGPYDLEYGWLNEPPIVGQSDAIVINISEGGQPSKVNISNLKVQAVYGGDSKYLTVQPLGEDTPGRYVAPIIPAQPGSYTLNLSGTLGSTPVQASVQPEEVQSIDYLQFPRSGNQGDGGSMDWLGIVGVILGAVGTVLGGIALVRRKA